MQRDSFAWEAAQQCFDAIMHRWLRGHALKEYACRLDSEENYVAQGFARFWQATVDNPAIAFHSLGAASRYLRACLHAVIIDTLRANSRARVVGLPEPGDPGEPLHEDHYDSGELWQAITHLLPDKRQLRVAYLLYQCGLKPREIVRLCFDEFDIVLPDDFRTLRLKLSESFCSRRAYLHRWYTRKAEQGSWPWTRSFLLGWPTQQERK
jgi:DNA-directed RNA polymerase specialized sigma24 family protein